jgi:hypothetical protein
MVCALIVKAKIAIKQVVAAVQADQDILVKMIVIKGSCKTAALEWLKIF